MDEISSSSKLFVNECTPVIFIYQMQFCVRKYSQSKFLDYGPGCWTMGNLKTYFTASNHQRMIVFANVPTSI